MTNKSSLRRRWRGEEERVAAIVADLQNRKDWTRHLRASSDGKRRALRFLDESGWPALITEAAPRDLRGINLSDIDLLQTDGLADTILDYATFNNVVLDEVSFIGSSLRGVVFSRGTSLNRIKVQFASFEGAVCRSVSLSNSKVQNTDLAGCDFRDSDLRSISFTDSNLAACDFRDADLRDGTFERVRITEEGLFGFCSFRRRWTQFGGYRQTKRELNARTSPRLGDYIERSSQIHEQRRTRPLYSLIHYLFSNFGRSATRFGLSTLGGFWLLFALLYASFPLPRCLKGTVLGAVLQQMSPKFAVGKEVRSLSIADALYFSAITITTLGYGDIAPAGTDNLARFLVGAEAVTGVVTLGVFIDRLMRDTPKDWE